MTSYSSRRRTARAVAVLVATACVAVSCRGSDLPTATAVPPTITVDAVDFTSTDFDVFDADVLIRQEGSAPGVRMPLAPRVVRYHMQRTLRPDGIWATTMSFDGPPSAAGLDADGSRIETDDTRSFFRRYDRAGALIAAPPGVPKPPAVATSIQAPPTRGGTPTRGWVGNFIVTSQSGERVRAGLEARLGKPQGRVAGRDRYVSTRGTTVVELLVDPATGAIVEEIITSNGKRLVHTVHTYATVAPGVLIKQSSRAKISRPDGSQSIIVTELRNVQLGKQRGAL